MKTCVIVTAVKCKNQSKNEFSITETY